MSVHEERDQADVAKRDGMLRGGERLEQRSGLVGDGVGKRTRELLRPGDEGPQPAVGRPVAREAQLLQVRMEDIRSRMPDGVAPEEVPGGKAREREMRALERRLEEIGPTNALAETECRELEERFETLRTQLDDISAARADLELLIAKLREEEESRYEAVFGAVAANFHEYFSQLAPGGRATLKHADGGTVHVMSATISVALAKELEEVHAKGRVALVCAPVLGRPDVAEKGELNVLAAGAPAALAKVQPVLDAIGCKTWVLGEQPHKANVAKLSANYMTAATIELLAEVFAFTEKSGLDPKVFFEMITNTLFAAPVFKTYGGLILERDFEPAKFKLKLGLKDVLLALAAGEAAEVPLPFASVLRDNFVDAIANGAADKDWAAMSQISFRRAGLKG